MTTSTSEDYNTKVIVRSKPSQLEEDCSSSSESSLEPDNFSDDDYICDYNSSDDCHEYDDPEFSTRAQTRAEDLNLNESEDGSIEWESFGSEYDSKCDVPPFEGKPGPRVQVNWKAEPIEYFKLFMTEQVLKRIVDCTNQYAIMNKNKKSRDYAWKP